MDLLLAVILTALSAGAVNLGYVLEQGAAARLPALAFRDRSGSLRRLAGSRAWVQGFTVETAGFVLYVGAVARPPLVRAAVLPLAVPLLPRDG